MKAGSPLLSFAYENVIDEICALNWCGLTSQELTEAAWAYYFFSIQFRENLQIACKFYPDDLSLRKLDEEERATSNLSPWPGVAKPGEKMDHDEFMRRLLLLSPDAICSRSTLEQFGRSYLQEIREMSPQTRAISIASYEGGGLERVFRAFLTSPAWDGALLQAFRHFLVEHIRFDSDPEQGHGVLSRQLAPDDRILPLWVEFKTLLVLAVPSLQVETPEVVQRSASA